MKKHLKKFLFLILLASSTQFSTAQNAIQVASKTQKTPVYVRAKVFCNEKQLREMGKTGLGIDHLAERTADYIVGEFSEWEMLQINQLGLKSEILIADLTTYYRERNTNISANARQAQITSSTPDAFNYGSMGGYLTASEMELELDSLFMAYPNLVTEKVSIGNSLEGRPIWMVKISDNPNVDENEPEALFTGVHHAREVITVTELIYLMQYLTENYGTDPAITYLLQNRELYFVPMFNVDGYVFNEVSSPQGGGLWRKNRRNNGDGTFGIDLNRNYGFQWGYDNLGSEGFTGSERFRGTAPFSEPETQVMRAFCQGRQFKTANNAHSYGNLLFYPWGYDFLLSPDDALYSLRGGLMTQHNLYTYGTSPNILYSVNGEANDWMYGEQNEKPKIMSMTSETGTNDDGFWPLQTRILPLCEEMLELLLDNAWFAGEYLLSSSTSPYNTTQLNFNLPVQTTNYGQIAANNVSVSFISNSQYIANTAPVTVNNLAPADVQSSGIPISLLGITPHNQAINGFVRTTFSDGYYIDSAATFVYTGYSTNIENNIAFAHSILYPNPTNGKCNVSLGKEMKENVCVEIFDLQGKILKKIPVISNEVSLNGISSGLYFYRFSDGEEMGNLQKLWIE